MSPAALARAADDIPAAASRRLAEAVASGGGRPLTATLDLLDRILLGVFDLASHGRLLFAVHPDPAVREAGRSASEAADRWFNAFRLDRGVYALLLGSDGRGDDTTTRFAREKMLREMRRAGVELAAPGRARAEALSNEIDALTNEFQANIVRHGRTIRLASAEDLLGLPEDFCAAHPPGPDGQVVLTTAYTDVLPVLAFARKAEVRRETLLAFQSRAYPQNQPVLARLLARRHELARLLGYPSWAAYAIEDKMMGSTQNARAFFYQMAGRLGPRARADLARFLERKRADVPGAERREPGDVGLWSSEGYYDQLVRREEFGVDSQALRDYFPYPRVRDGLFALCRRLFGLTITPAEGASSWHPAVEAFDVEREGQPIGRFYLDLAPRDGKYEHAAQFDVRSGLAGVQRPQAALVGNFLEPDRPQETRMRHSDVVVFFHEFGHLLHALLAGHGRRIYHLPSQIEWDFIEAPSQLFEEWATDPESVATFAGHVGTGAPIPPALVARLRRAGTVGRAMRWLTQTAAAAVSLDLYDRDPTGVDLTDAFRGIFDRFSAVPLADGAHFECAWGHLAGYSALYYTYAWSLVIARDLLSPFADRGTILDRETAERYARAILAPGSSKPARDLVRDYLGREFTFAAFEGWVAGDP